jgi:germination protein M
MTTLVRILITGLLLAALVGCDSRVEPASPPGTAAPPAESAQAPATAAPVTTAPGEQNVVRAYFVRDDTRDFVVAPVARQVTGDGVAVSAMESLLTGPTPDEQRLGLHSDIPAGTALNGVNVTDGIATVDLSSEYESGGGTSSMGNRVAQVVFTLTQFPTVDAVRFWLDGEPVELLSGEGVILEEPQTRADWEGLSPAILVESPLPYTDVTSPLRITGTANTFEATFEISVTDAAGEAVYAEFATATSGSGTRGTFDVTADFAPTRAGWGTLTLYERSAEDGSAINVVTVPVRLA